MNVILDTKDIRFSDSKINILLRGGVVSRDVLRNSVNNIIDMYDVPFGLAKRINDITAIDVREDKELNNWYHIVCGDTEELAAVYSKKTDTKEVEVSFSCDPKLSEEAKEAIDKAADAVVRRFGDMNSDRETFLEDSASVSEEVKVERVYSIEESSEDEEYDEVDDDHSDEEEEEEETTTVETSSNSTSQPQQNNTNNVYRRQVNNKKRRR